MYGGPGIKVRAHFNLGGLDEAVTTCSFLQDGGTTEAGMGDAIDRFYAFWNAIKDRFFTAIVLDRVVSHDYEELIADGESTVADPGTNASGCVPFQLTPVVSLRTGVPGRQNRGRMYLPPPAYSTLSTLADGQIVAAAVTDFADSAKAHLLDGPTPTDDLTLVVVSNVGAGHATAVNQIKVGNVWDTQRRRRNKIHETYTIGA